MSARLLSHVGLRPALFGTEVESSNRRLGAELICSASTTSMIPRELPGSWFESAETGLGEGRQAARTPPTIALHGDAQIVLPAGTKSWRPAFVLVIPLLRSRDRDGRFDVKFVRCWPLAPEQR